MVPSAAGSDPSYLSKLSEIEYFSRNAFVLCALSRSVQNGQNAPTHRAAVGLEDNASASVHWKHYRPGHRLSPVTCCDSAQMYSSTDRRTRPSRRKRKRETGSVCCLCVPQPSWVVDGWVRFGEPSVGGTPVLLPAFQQLWLPSQILGSSVEPLVAVVLTTVHVIVNTGWSLFT